MKMRCLITIAGAFLILSASPSYAQVLGENVKVFVGYANLRGEDGSPGALDRTSLNGINASVTGTIHGFGLTGDVSFNRNGQSTDIQAGRYTANTDLYYVLGGPSFQYSVARRFEPFGRFLLGAAQTKYKNSVRGDSPPNGTSLTSFQTSTTSLALGMGGGVDLHLGDGPYRIRLIQVDYTPVFLSDNSVQVLLRGGTLTPSAGGKRLDNLRFSFGFVF